MVKVTFKSLVVCSLFAFCIACSNNSNQLDMELIPVKSGEKWGYINKKGEYVINPQFENVFFFRDGLALVEASDGKLGFIGKDGKYKIAAQFMAATPFFEGLAFVVSEGGYPVCIDKSGKTMFELKQAEIVFAFSDGLALFCNENLDCGFVDKSGKVVVNPQFDDARPFSEGLAAVERDGKWGFIDKTGKIVINPQFEKVGDFVKGKAIFATDDDKFGYIDTKGNYVINPQFDYASNFSDGSRNSKNEFFFGWRGKYNH